MYISRYITGKMAEGEKEMIIAELGQIILFVTHFFVIYILYLELPVINISKEGQQSSNKEQEHNYSSKEVKKRTKGPFCIAKKKQWWIWTDEKFKVNQNLSVQWKM